MPKTEKRTQQQKPQNRPFSVAALMQKCPFLQCARASYAWKYFTKIPFLDNNRRSSRQHLKNSHDLYLFLKVFQVPKRILNILSPFSPLIVTINTQSSQLTYRQRRVHRLDGCLWALNPKNMKPQAFFGPFFAFKIALIYLIASFAQYWRVRTSSFVGFVAGQPFPSSSPLVPLFSAPRLSGPPPW